MAEPTERIAILLELQQQEFEKRAKSAGAAIDRLERKYSPLAAAEAKLERQQLQFNAALEAGTIDAVKHAKGMGLVQREYDQTIARSKSLTNQVVSMNSAVSAQTGFMTRNRAVLQQTGYQVGDFAVQVQGGQSALVAFSQQGSQLLGVLGPWGAVMGAVLAVTAPLAGYLLSGSEAGVKFEDALAGIRDVTESLEQPLDQLGLTTEELEQIYGNAADKVRALIQVQAELRVALAEQNLEGYVTDLGSVIGQYTVFETKGRTLRNTLERVASDFGLSGDAARNFSDLLGNLEAANTLDGQKAALQDILGFIEANNVSLRDMPPALQAALDEMITLSNESDRAAAIAAELEASDFGADGIAGGADEAARLAKNLGISLAAAQRLAALGPQGVVDPNAEIGRSGAVDPRTVGGSIDDRLYAEADAFLANYKPVSGRGSSSTRRGSAGGGSRSSKREEPNLFSIAEAELEKLERQTELLGKSAGEVAELKVRYDLLDEAKKRGIPITDELTAKIDAEAANVGELADKYDQARDKMAALEQISGQFEDAIIDAAMGGVDSFESLAKAISKAALQYALFGNGPLSSIFGGDGGGVNGGGFAGLLGGLLSFDGGGRTGAGSRSGGVDGKGGFPAILHPNETVIDHTKGGSGGSLGVGAGGMGGSSGGSVQVNYAPVIDARGADQAAIVRLQAQLDSQAVNLERNVQNILRNGSNRRLNNRWNDR